MYSFDTLYVIGNGFDRAHGLKSSYLDFKQWLSCNNPELLRDMEDVWDNNSELWRDFEKTLGDVNFQSVERKYRRYHQEENLRGDAEFRKKHPGFPPTLEFHNIQDKLMPMSEHLKKGFNDWVEYVNTTLDSYVPIYNINRDSYFINFNYTETLEKLYGINSDHILHIHGKANSEDEILFGHDKTYGQIEYEIEKKNLGIGSTSVGDFSLCIGSLFKNVDYNLFQIKPILVNINNVKDIYVCGFSFGDIDLPYFEEIHKRTYRNKAKWRVSYYTEEDKNKINLNMRRLGFCESDFEFFQLIDIMKD